MTDASMTLLEYLRKSGMELDGDFLKESIRLMSQLLMELEVEAQIGAAKHERSASRSTYRNGYRARSWETFLL